MHRRLTSFVGVVVALVLVACSASADSSTPEPATPTLVRATKTPPLPTLVPTPISTTVIETYTVRSGDTLGAISARFDLSIDDLMKLNGITNPNSLQIGQALKISLTVARMAPADFILPDSELVYGPSYASFDIAAYASQSNGYLSSFREKVEGEMMTGAQIIQLVSERYSVGPRALLALLELEGGWVTGNSLSQNQISSPMGLQDANRTSLFFQASWAANHLNEGYYGKLSGRLQAYKLKDRSRARLAPTVNPGTAAIQNVLSIVDDWGTFVAQVSPNGYLATYRRLFGDPSVVTIDPLIPANTKQPDMRLPWNDGATWYYTGGPHSAWGDLAAWSAIDLTPNDMAGSGSCIASREWAVSVAPGRVLRSERGRVVVALGDSQFQGNGWTVLYMHMANNGRAVAGTTVNAGDRIGHPSCEGGDANASHLHIGRLYNGQWIDPETVPFVLGGWTVTSSGQQYEGKMTRGTETRDALNGRNPTKNPILAEPPR